MDLTLTPGDQARLTAALSALLAPPEAAPDPAVALDGWRREVNERVKALVGADAAVFEVPGAASPRPVFTDDYPSATPDEFLALFWPLAEKCRIKERIGTLSVATRRQMWAPAWEEYGRSVYRNEFQLPNRMLDGVVVVANVEAGPVRGIAQLIIHRTSASSQPIGPREEALLKMLQPAFRAGVETRLRLVARAVALAALLDDLGVALAVVDLAGCVRHQSPAFTALLEGEPERARLLQAVRVAGYAVGRSYAPASRGAGAPLTPAVDVVTGGACYHVRATSLGPDALGAEPAAVVLVERPARADASDEVLSARFGLTRQELRVARLLAERKTTREIADALFISVHTARHHVEHVLEKLGVRSRTGVFEVLSGR